MTGAWVRLIHEADDGTYVHAADIAAWCLDAAVTAEDRDGPCSYEAATYRTIANRILTDFPTEPPRRRWPFRTRQ